MSEKKNPWLLDKVLREEENSTKHGGWWTDLWDGPRTGVSERLPSTHPVTTSEWCVWKQTHTGVVVICSDQPVHDRCVVVGFVNRWKEDFMSIINRSFTRLLMMGTFSDDGDLLLRLLMMGSMMWREDTTDHGVRVVFTSMSCLQTDQSLCIYVLYYMFFM